MIKIRNIKNILSENQIEDIDDFSNEESEQYNKEDLERDELKELSDKYYDDASSFDYEEYEINQRDEFESKYDDEYYDKDVDTLYTSEPNEEDTDETNAISLRESRTKEEVEESRKLAKEKINNDDENISLQAEVEYAESVGLPIPKKHEPVKNNIELQNKISETYQKLDSIDDGHEETEDERNIYNQYKEKYPKIFQEYNIKDYKDFVIKAYNKLKEEIDKQFNILPIDIEFHDGDRDYENSDELLDDVHNFHHMWVFSGGENHPMLGEDTTDENGHTANDKFRAVHDFFGHSVRGFQFGKRGEENAWIEHSKMLTPLSQIALSTETRGQNSYVNFSGVNDKALEKIKLGNQYKKKGKEENNQDLIDKGEKLVKEGGSEFKFAEQKAIILPLEFTNLSKLNIKTRMKKIKNIKSELIKKSNKGYRFIINSLEKLIAEYNYEEGEIGNTQYQLQENYLGKANSIEEVFEKCSNYGASTDINNWIIIDGRLSCSIMEDDDANEVDLNSDTYQRFEDGEINLWNAYYDVYLELITPEGMLIENPTSQQLAEATGIQEY